MLECHSIHNALTAATTRRAYINYITVSENMTKNISHGKTLSIVAMPEIHYDLVHILLL